MGKIVMPKNSALLDEIESVLQIYYEAGTWIPNNEYKTKLKAMIGDDQYSSSYTKKAQITSYFGFTIWEDIHNPQSRRRITDSGKEMYEAIKANDTAQVQAVLMNALETVKFGRENCGCPDSNSDVEPPALYIRAILDLGYLTYREFAFMLWKLEDLGANYTDTLEELRTLRSSDTVELGEEANKYADCKPIMILVRWGFLCEDESDTTGGKHIIIVPEVLRKFETRLRNLKIYNIDMDCDESVDDKSVNTDEIMQLDNQQFAFACFNLMKEHKLLVDDNLRLLADEDKCVSMFKHNNYHGIFFKLDSDIDENEQKNGQDGIPSYYAENYEIRGVKYAVSSQWRPVTETDDSRKPFVNWIIEQLQKVKYETGYENDLARNRILFGAPGTGKSYTINKERKELLGKDNELDYERVTFHPDYSYANFVGTYKPVPSKDSDGKDAITYEYVPGPFMRVFVKALKNGRTNNVNPYLLIIEEINRANVAAVFGDVFQLLDRDKHGVSEYSIQASEDIKKFLAKPENLGGIPEDYQKIRIPDNMFIWATMNSADQGVFPMDTAFKRRWDFKYLGIDESDAEVRGKTVILGMKVSQKVEWNKLRKAINKFLATQKINEDKQLGPYFIAKRIVVPENGDEIDSKKFIETFKNKVIMYLFEDAAKQKRATLFEGCFQNSGRYSEICKEFEEKGVGIFNSEIQMAAEPEDLPSAEATKESATGDTDK